MKKIVLLGAVLVTVGACKPNDNLPCDGKGVDIYYKVTARDSALLQVLLQDTFIFRRTINSQVDTVKLVKVSEETETTQTDINTIPDCPEITWLDKVTITFSDSNKNVSVNHVIQTSSEVPRYFYFHPLTGGFTYALYHDNYKNTSAYVGSYIVNGVEYNDVLYALSFDGKYRAYFNGSHGIVEVLSPDERWELLIQ